MMKLSCVILTVVTLNIRYVHCANILGVFTTMSISHQVVYQTLWKELSLRGHQVTVLTPCPLKDPQLVNLTEVDLNYPYRIYKENFISKSIHKELPKHKLTANLYEIIGTIAEAQLSQPAVQAFIHNESKKFDVMLVEFLHPLMYALSAKFNCPMIGIVSFDALLPGHDAVGNPSHPALNPDVFLELARNLRFIDRFYSWCFAMWMRYYYHSYLLPKNDKLARKYISTNLPYLGDIEKNVSMLFINANPIMNTIRPNVPAVIQIGRIHIRKPKPLPLELQEELDNATQGAVYLSLGSNIKSVALSLEIQHKIFKALSRLPYKILWKWESNSFPKHLKNVVIRKWFPQQDILGHPNVKVFLTQGGVQSIEEAISRGVPLVIMPLLADQPFNAIKAVDVGIAQSINPEKFTVDQLSQALIEVAENPKYRNKIKEVANLMDDEPMTGLEKAVWWTEYVIRHKGAYHLRSPVVTMPWYQYLLLDVFGFFLAFLLVLVYILYKIVLFCSKKMKNILCGIKLKTL